MDAQELTALLRRNAGLIHRIAYAYCRDAADREDVFQEVAVQLWRSRDRYDRRFRETTWVYRIALNVAISHRRRERRHREGREELAAAAIFVAAPAVEPSPDVAVLLELIDELGALDKALVLLDLDGNDHASIAEVLGIGVSNVGTKLWRIRERLRAAFERRAASDSPEKKHATR